MLPEKKIDFGRHTNEFLCTLFNCLCVFLVVFPLIKNLGYTSQEKYEQLLPLNRYTASITNSIFLYICGCLTIFLVGIFYNSVVFPRLNKAALTLESIASLFVLTILWVIPLGKFALVVFFLRYLVSVMIYKIIKDKIDVDHPTFHRLNIFFYMASLIIFCLFFHAYLLAPLVSELKVERFIKGVFLLPVLLGLAHYQTRLHRYVIFGLDLIVFSILTVLVFKNDLSYFDYSAFLGAVNDVILGKDILANVILPYGFFNVYFVAVILDLFRVQDYYVGLSLIISVLYVLGYSSIYIFLRFYTKDIFLSMAFLFVVLYFDFYCLHIPTHWLPQSTFLRFGSYLPVFFFLFVMQKKTNRWLEWLLAGLVAILFFWVSEYGSYILVALIGISVCQYFFFRQGDRRKWFYRLLKIMSAIIFLAVFLTIRVWFKYGHGPIWSDLLFYQRLFAQSGLAMNQLSKLGLWVVPFFIYWVTIYVCLKYYPNIRYADAWLFLSIFGLQFFLYFVGKGGGFVLARIVLPAVILTAAFWSFLLRQDIKIQLANRCFSTKHLIYGLIFFLCIFISNSINKAGRDLSLLYFVLNNPKEFADNRKIPSLVKFLRQKNNYVKFQHDIAVIDRLIGLDKPLAILSNNDTLYYIYAHRKSLFKNAFYPHFATLPLLYAIADTIVQSDIQYLFVDNSDYQCYDNLVTQHNSMVLGLVSKYFVKRTSLGFLDVYERIQ